jgi:hypothetical protein
MKPHLPNINWTDKELIDFCKRYFKPVVSIKLYGDDNNNVAKIDYSVKPTSVTRYKSAFINET